MIVLALVIALLAAMPWRRPQPNALFLLELLNTEIGDNARVIFVCHRKGHPDLSDLKRAA
jgi:hypothetical protein